MGRDNVLQPFLRDQGLSLVNCCSSGQLLQDISSSMQADGDVLFVCAMPAGQFQPGCYAGGERRLAVFLEDETTHCLTQDYPRY